MTEIEAKAMSAAMNPYSIAVAPAVSLESRLKSFIFRPFSVVGAYSTKLLTNVQCFFLW